MAQESLEKRVDALEKSIAALLADRVNGSRAKDWRRTRGIFTGDDLMKQVFEEGSQIRKSQRKHGP